MCSGEIHESKIVDSGEKAGKTKVCSGEINKSTMVHSGEKGRQNKGA